jgi:hypothetical protein
MPNTDLETQVRIREALTRNEYARYIIAGFRSTMPTLVSVWDYLEDALNDAVIIAALIESGDAR